jgi:hypothetical protein
VTGRERKARYVVIIDRGNRFIEARPPGATDRFDDLPMEMLSGKFFANAVENQPPRQRSLLTDGPTSPTDFCPK